MKNIVFIYTLWIISLQRKSYSPNGRVIDDLRSPDTFDTRLGERASANVTPWNSLKLVLVTFLVTCETIERKNISFSQRIRPDGSRLFRTRGNLIECAWTTSRMRKVGSSRPWLFHIFQLRALIFPLLVGQFFSNFWWQLRSIGCVYIPIFKKFCRWEKS